MNLWSFKALGDQALIVETGREDFAWQLAAGLRRMAPAWLDDVVPAYTSVGVFFQISKIRVSEVRRWLEEFLVALPMMETKTTPKLHRIPVDYQDAPDADRICELTQLSWSEVVHWHSQTIYTVYAIGFVPGFPYLGYLPQMLQGLPRLASPRVRVPVGSVGITGKQTGIYPLERPGGWNLIGRTPMKIVDLGEEFFPLHVGDQVKFEPMVSGS